MKNKEKKTPEVTTKTIYRIYKTTTKDIEISDEFVCRFWPREQHPHITTADKISGQH